MTYPVDLHLHTYYSDGNCSPTEAVARARELGVEVVALTDHDTVRGLPEALTAGRELGVTVIPGIEFSTLIESRGAARCAPTSGVHLLGYFIDYRNPRLVDTLKQQATERATHTKRRIALLQQHGLKVTTEEVFSLVWDVPMRRHIAEVVMRHHPERFLTQQKFYKEFLSRGGKAYVPRPKLSFAEALELIIATGGVPVMAHPGLYTHIPDIVAVLQRARERGLRGLEVSYPYDKARDYISAPESGVLHRRFAAVAAKVGLPPTGGSDFHGPDRQAEIGEAGMTRLEWAKFLATVNNTQHARGR